MLPPKNITKLRSLCGILNYLSKLTPHVASVIRPFTELLKPGVKYSWNKCQQSAFDSAKKMINSLSSLQYLRQVVVSAEFIKYE